MADKKELPRRHNPLSPAAAPPPLPPVVPPPPGPMLTPAEEAWLDEMYADLRRIALATLARLGVREWERDEVACDALVRVAKNLHRINGPGHARNYVRRAAVCEWYDRLRGRRSRPTVGIAADPRDDAADPAEHVAVWEAARVVLAGLSEPDGEIVARYIADPNFERHQAAAELGVHYQRLARIIRKAEAAVKEGIAR